MEARLPIVRAFTLVELLAVILVATLLLAAAVPAFDGLAARRTLDGIERGFFVSLANAKQAAVTRNERVSLCPTRDGRRCLPRGHWHRGWMTFVDTDADRKPDADEPVLERHGALDSRVRLSSSRYRRVITFFPSGTAGGSNATFTLCLRDEPARPRAVVLSRLGRIRTGEGEANDCAPR